MRLTWLATAGTIACLALAATAQDSPPPARTDDTERKRYIVRFDVKSGDGYKKSLIDSSPKGSVVVTTSYTHVLNGGFAADLTPAGLEFLQSQPGVMVEPDGVVRALYPVAPEDPAERAAALMRKRGPPPRAMNAPSYSADSWSTPWGLDRIDHPTLPLNGLYSALELPLSSVHAFVIDTGLFREHSELKDGVCTDDADHHSVFNEAPPVAADRQGHGTHCAGTIGGTHVGVAPGVRLHGVKVLGDDGSGTNEGVAAGMDWVLTRLDEIEAETGARPPAVASMSLGGGYSQFINDAVTDLKAGGVTVVVAAGNDASDACYGSPASSADAITVGSSALKDGADVGSYFTNYGPCVDLYAPGSDIISAGIADADELATMSGTSMACPHVSGVVAQLLARTPSASPDEVKARLMELAVDGAMADVEGVTEPNVLLQALAAPSPPSPPPAPPSSPPPPSPPPSPPAPPPPPSTPPSPPCFTVLVEIEPDMYPEETTWELYHAGDDRSVVLSGGSAGGEGCFPAGEYTFEIYDSFGDGLCCDYGEGWYKVFAEGALVAHGAEYIGSYPNGEATTFAIGDAGDGDDHDDDDDDDGSTPPPVPSLCPEGHELVKLGFEAHGEAAVASVASLKATTPEQMSAVSGGVTAPQWSVALTNGMWFCVPSQTCVNVEIESSGVTSKLCLS